MTAMRIQRLRYCEVPGGSCPLWPPSLFRRACSKKFAQLSRSAFRRSSPWFFALVNTPIRMRSARAAVRVICVIKQPRNSRVIAMIHGQDTVSFLGVPVASSITIEDSEAILRAIRLTPPDQPIDIILHTPGGLVLAAVRWLLRKKLACRARDLPERAPGDVLKAQARCFVLIGQRRKHQRFATLLQLSNFGFGVSLTCYAPSSMIVSAWDAAN